MILGALILAPVAVTYLLKSNAALGFLALCAGFVVSTSAVGDLKQLLNEMDLSVTETTLALIFIALPLFLTLLVVRAGTKHGLQFVLQLLAALAAGGFLALSIAPLIDARDFNLEGSEVWKVLQDFQAAVVGGGALVSLMLIWTSGFSRRGHKKHK